METLEFKNLLVNASLTVKSGLERKESRGAHARDDFTVSVGQCWVEIALYFSFDVSMFGWFLGLGV